jgi:DNA-binding SARP family transcriptional activator
VEFRLLGHVEVREGERLLPVGRAQDRAYLADLLLHANQVLSSDRIVVDLWGEEPPASAAKMVQMLASRLRVRLDAREWPDVSLATHPHGYELRLDADRIDAHRFERLVREGDAAMALDPATASARYRTGLDLWRGPALDDMRDVPFTSAAVVRLEELRSRAFVQWATAELRRGHHAQVLADLMERCEHDRYREDLHATLMLALYRSGRQVEALERYADIDRRLRHELGIEPSGELRSLQVAILNQDPSLDHAPMRAVVDVASVQDPDPGPATLIDPARLMDPTPPTPTVRGGSDRRRGRLRSAGVFAVMVIGLGAGAMALGALPSISSGSAVRPPVQATKESAAVIDVTSDRIVAEIPVGTDPGPLALDGRFAWVGDIGDRTLTQIERSSRQVVRTIGLARSPTSVTDDGQDVWVQNGFSGTMTRVFVGLDQASGQLYPHGQQSGLLAVAAAPGALWVGMPNAELIRLDPSSVQPETVIGLRARAQALAVAAGRVWYIGFGGSWVRAVDPTDLSHPTEVTLDGEARAIGVGDARILIATADPDRLVAVDPVGEDVVGSYDLPGRPAALAANDTTAWIVTDTGELLRIDLAISTTHRYDIGRPVSAIAADASEAWITVR